MALSTRPNFAYATLLTRPSYLPGVLTLAHTLHLHSSYPLVVLTTALDGSPLTSALEIEARLNPGIHVIHISPLLPHSTSEKSAAPRFADTWTKLRVFELIGYDRLVFLDADIVVRGCLDHLFWIELPGHDWIGAAPACVCNLDGDDWAPTNWKPENCAYSFEDLEPSVGKLDPPPLNSGVFVFQPSAELERKVTDMFATSNRLGSYACPDQDFMAEEVFRGKWKPLSWEINALKTMKYWHANLWSAEAELKGLKAVHYIVDKPWVKRIASDGIAGHLGRDGGTHAWWWRIWEQWLKERSNGREGEELVLKLRELNIVAPKLNENDDQRQVSENRKSGLPVTIPTLEGMSEKAKRGAEEANKILKC